MRGNVVFERYTEKARRAIFFARYEASSLGLQWIDPNCLLLGLVRENGEISTKWLAMKATELHRVIESQTMRLKEVSTSVDLPLDSVAKRVLNHAAEECQRLAHQHIGTEHLFLGLLREPDTFAAKRIKERGITLAQVRKGIAESEPSLDAGARVARPRGLQIRLLGEDGDHIAALPWIARLPAAGEALAITDENGNMARYRVLDITWSIRTVESAPELAEVVLKVRKEQ